MGDPPAYAGIMELAIDKTIGALDPRTVSRSQMLDRLGGQRPSFSVIIVASVASELLVNAFAIKARHQNIQVLTVFETCIASTIDLIRVAGSQCVGKFIVLLPPNQLFLPSKMSTLKRFAEDSSLAATLIEGPKAESAIVIRETVWTALDGIDPNYNDWSWAIRDFCMRVRAIGCVAPDWPVSVNEKDAELFQTRVTVAPARSRPCGSSSAATRVTLYTAITNCYDILKPQPAHLTAPGDRVAFLDQATLHAHTGRARGWRLAPHDPLPDIADPQRKSRYYKINSHHALAGVPYSLWVDASIGIVCPYSLGRLAELFLADHDLCVFTHYQRQSIYEEAEACKLARLDAAAIIDAQIAKYRAERLPPQAGLIEAPILLRRHSKRMMEINEVWWDEIQVGSRRDQLSFNYVAWKHGFHYAIFPLTLAMRNGLFVKYRRPNN
jgi:hypothetical protein